MIVDSQWPPFAPETDDDSILAMKLHAEECAEAEVANGIDPCITQEGLFADNERLKMSDGLGTNALTKACNFVEAIVKLHQKESQNHAPNQILPIPPDDMVVLAERVFVAQKTFRAKGKPTNLDIGYHYTKQEHLDRIKKDGLLNRQERAVMSIDSRFNGASYGEGIYTWDHLQAKSSPYGPIGIMVARLKGSTLQSQQAGGSYQSGNDSITVENKWVVLHERFQCLPLFQFPESLSLSTQGQWLVQDIQLRSQAIVDEFFNGAKRPAAKPLSEEFPVNKVSQHRVIKYEAPEALQFRPPCSFYTEKKLSRDASVGHCPICWHPLTYNMVSLKKCGHCFHAECVDAYISKSTTCPVCCSVLDSHPQGTMPSGTMRVTVDPAKCCSGYPSTAGTIVIRYVVPANIQKSYHDHPGQWHGSADRTAYLPYTPQGVQLLNRLEYAFSRGLTFRVGTSLTSGTADSVTWASIHHKTSTTQGPHGYPDPRYIGNCHKELDGLGVPRDVGL